MRKHILTKNISGKITTVKEEGARKEVQKKVDLYCTDSQDLSYHDGHITCIRFKDNSYKLGRIQ